MERAKLEEFNHWWTSGEVDTDLALPFRRDVYKEIDKRMDKRFILALVGIRRIGKTTTMYQLIQNLIRTHIDKTNILFFSFDEISIKLSEILETYKEIHSKDTRAEKIYVFLDEIQKCGGWENELKKYYDLYPKIKFIISGSESIFIRKKTKENLAGRIFEFNLSTFSFETDKDFKEYIKSLVVDKIVYKDIPKLFELKDPDFLKVLLELISSNPGMYIDYQSLSRQFEKDRRVIKDYLNYLKESFLITLLGNYRKGSTAILRKKKRAYPTDNALIYLYKSKIEEDFFGRMIETLTVNKLKASSFWKNGGEVDIVHENIPIEVKYREKINLEDFKAIKEFMKKFKQKEGMMLTKNEDRNIKFSEGAIKLIPVL